MPNKSELLTQAELCEKFEDWRQCELLVAAFSLIFPDKYMKGRSGFDPFRWEWFERRLSAEAYESAALLLIPEGWRIDWLQHLLDEPLWTCGLYRRRPGIERVCTGPDGARSAAAAIAAAALRALAREASDD